MITDRLDTWRFFDLLGYDLSGKDILDFGCNRGDLLSSCGGRIDPPRLVGVDCMQDALDSAAADHPTATWIKTNRSNPYYNPNGASTYDDLTAPLTGKTFDFILVYAMFAHMSMMDLAEAIDFLVPYLRSGGKLVASYCDIEDARCVEWYRMRRAGCDPVDATLDYQYLVGPTATQTAPTAADQFVCFYKAAYLGAQLSVHNPTFTAAPFWSQHALAITAP